SAGAQDAHSVLIFGMHAQDKHRQARGFSVQLFQHVETAFVRHGDIQQHDVAGLLSDHLHGFVAIRGFAADGHAAAFRDDAFQTFTYDSVIIDDNNVN